MLEKEIETYLVNSIKFLPLKTRIDFKIKTKKCKFIGERGCPDRIVGSTRAFYWVEFKRPVGGVTSREQVETMNWLNCVGQDARIIDSKELVDLLIFDLTNPTKRDF